MKKIISLCLVFAVALAGCATSQNQSSSGSSGVTSSQSAANETNYEVTANGYGGELVLDVVVNGDTIRDIKVVTSHESSPVFTRAFPVIKKRILDAQTPIVDSVSGATFSSYAVKSAVAQAMKKNGKDFGEITMATAAEHAAPKQMDDVTAQLVIVGGGPAGLTAAIAAKDAGVEKVILVEKLDILSGNGKFDMNFFDLYNSQAQKAAGNEMTKEEFLESKKTSTDSDARKQVWAEEAYNLDAWLRSKGIQLNHNYGGTNHMAEADAYAGEHIQAKLEENVYNLGVDVRTGTKGTDLIMKDGKAVGVKVETRDGYYNIYSDAVVVATGGFSHNKELLAKYAPGAERVATSNQMGATGDFIPVFEANNFKMANMDVLSVFKMIIKNRRDLTGAGDGFILVNENGERFIDETKSGLEMAHAILDQPNSKVFYIYDQNLYDSSYRLQKHNNLGYHVKADTLQELAEKLGINADNLIKSVETYNTAVTGKGKDPFRETPYTKEFLSEGPFYGVQVESAIHMTKGGVVANEKAQVLTNNDKVVDGLYAAGEVTATSGAYSASVVFGKIAGEQAAEYIKANRNAKI